MSNVWKEIEGYEGYYEASSEGEVKSVDRYVYSPLNGKNKIKGRTLKPCISHKGYKVIVLSKLGGNHTLIMHRVIAKTFIPNPNNYSQINHINGIKTDNRIENLEWCNNSYNHTHAVDMGLYIKRDEASKKRRRPIILFNEKENTTISFPKITDAAIYLNTSSGAIGNVLNGSRRGIKKNKVMYL